VEGSGGGIGDLADVPVGELELAEVERVVGAGVGHNGESIAKKY